MRRWIVLVAIGALLAVPVASGAEWLRSGYDPGRTGAIPFEGPQTNDTAFQVQLPGTPTEELVVANDAVYVLTEDGTYFEGNTESLTDAALWRIDLSTGKIEKRVELPDDTAPLKILPGFVLYEDGGDLVALDRPSGQERWRTQVLANDSDVLDRDYTGVIQVGETLYIGYSAVETPTASAPTGCQSCPNIGGVAAFDLVDEELDWTWKRTSGPTPEPDQHTQEKLTDIQGGGTPDVQELAIASIRLAADGQRVYGYTMVDRFYDYKERRQFEVWAIEEGEGTLLGNDTEQERTDVFTPAGGERLGHWTRYSCCAYPAVTERALNIRLDAFQALNKADGSSVWPSPTPAGRTDQIEIQGATSLGVRGDAFIGTSPQTIYRLDAITGGLDWMKTDPTPARTYGTSPTALDEGTAYVPEHLNLTGFSWPGLEARDLQTGDLLWSWHHTPDVGFAPENGQTNILPSEPAFGPGIAVWGAKDGTVHVIGETGASLGSPQVKASSVYPEPGENLTLEVAEVEPGAMGQADRYRVVWGDGTTSGWQNSTTFTHAYDEEGNRTARVQAGNANQTSSTFVTMHVGQEVPTEPNMIETAFARENQDLTFGILGILVAVTGGAIGVARRYRERSRLQEELEVLEEGFEDSHGNPRECEAFLETRKARARSLVLDGELTEEKFGVIESRIEELRGELRISMLDERFAFLPYGMVRTLERMLEDGHINAFERDALMDALDEQDMLTEAQKGKVERLVGQWSTGGEAT